MGRNIDTGLECVLGVLIELVLADTCGEVWGEVGVDDLGNGKGKGGLGVEELELLRDERWAKAVHRSQPKRMSVDLIPLSKGAGDFRAFVVKVVANVGRNNLSLSHGAREGPVIM